MGGKYAKSEGFNKKTISRSTPQAESKFSEHGFESVAQTDRRLEPTFFLLHITLPL